MVLFQMNDKDEKFCFFEKTFLFANISIDMIFGIFLLTLSNVETNFNTQEYMLRLFTTAESISLAGK